MKKTNNAILNIICNNSALLILYFNSIINSKHIYIQTEHFKNKINQYIYIYIYIQTEHVNNKINQ